MQRFENVAIVGVGLIGASIGLALRERGLAGRVIGIGRRPTTLEVARERGAVTETTTDLKQGVAEAELVVVCTPVATIVETVEQVAAASPASCLITDAGSTKGEIVAALDHLSDKGPRFVGSHPLAGGENSGPQHGRADLLVGRVVVLTPAEKTRPEDLQTLEQFWCALGARVVSLSPAEHDEALATTSHLPHLVAAAIAGSTPKQYAALVATGWLDTTRIAAGDAELWQQILLGNRDHVLKSLDRFEALLTEMREAIENVDQNRLKTLLLKAKRTRDALGS